jgi:hypothetical protein
MKKITLFIAFVVFANVSFGQAWLENLPKTKSSKQLTFFDYQKAFNDYWKPYDVKNGYYNIDGVKKKASGWKQFKRWEWNMEGQINPSTGEFPSKTAQQIYDKYRKSNSSIKGTKSASWVSLGTNSSDGGYAGVGRINCIAFHPSDNNTYWIGAPAGGLWKTTNNGSSWTCLTDDNAVLGVSSIIIPSDYATTNTIYIATGDRDASDNYSIGVLKSTDGGSNWNTTGLTYSLSANDLVYKLLLDPTLNSTIIAATSNGVYKTTDSGVTWSTQLTSTAFIDMEYKPGDFNTLYGSTKDGYIYVSTNSGLNWSPSSDFGSRVELAVTAADANIVYAVVAASDDGLESIQKSTNSGASFTEVFAGSTKNLLGWYEGDGTDATGGQGWYDLGIAVSPTDADIILVGGVNSWKSTDGGLNWSLANHWYGGFSAPAVHADKHNLTYRSNGDLFECNDGGIYISTDNGTAWTDKTNGMEISQMYKLSVSQTVVNEVLTGLQDNGTKLLSGGTWADVKGGDGMECLIDYTDVNIQYGTYTNGNIARTTNHWTSATNITYGDHDNNSSTPDEPLNGLDETGAWVSPYVIDPTNNQILYLGMNNIWKTTNRGDAWTKISTMNSIDKIRSMAIASSNASVLYVADNDRIWTTVNGGTSWSNITGALPVSSSYIKYITVKNDDPNTLWIAMSGYNSNAVFQSTNGGASWTNISTGLPSIPAYTIVQNTQITSEVHLYVGTELGIYFKKGSDNWIVYNTDLPNVKIGEIEMYYDNTPANSKLRAATYGRGLWETPVEQVSSDLATVSTTIVTNITTNSATSGGNVTDIGLSSVTERGIVFGTTLNPTTSDIKIIDGSTGIGTYTSSLTGLSASTTYHVRAYAINTQGTAYGANVEFATSCGVITTFPITENFESGALPECWTYDGRAWTYATGGNSGNPASAHGGSYNALFFNGSYSVDVSKLITPQMDFTGISNATLTFWHTQAAWDSDQDQLRVYYKTSSGGSWTLLNEYTSNITEWTEETITLPNLSTDYYVAFEATGQYGYGVTIDDITIDNADAAELATVATTAVSDITVSSATCGGNVANEGSSTVTERGIVWSISANPTISDTKVIDGSTGTGAFTSSITGLSESTTYYVRAYAINTQGTSYGADEQFTTLNLATVTTNTTTDITSNSATSGGNVTNEGSSSVTERGIVWSTSANPTTSDNKISSGTGAGAYTSSITGLTTSITYYVRAYAINTQGIAYGADEEFTTITTSLVDLKVMGINIYPNPTSGVINISSDKNINNTDIKVVDLSGKIVFSKTYKNLMKETIDLSHLSKNVYILKLKTEDKLINSKIVIE